MKTAEFTFPSKADGLMIAATMWGEASGAKAQVLIAHGMAEHMARYERFAQALTSAGYLVYALDHRGHGKTILEGEEPGSFGEAGWNGLVDDIITLGQIMKEDNPGTPLVLFGHSMGSFAAQQVAIKVSGELDALVLSGSAAQDKLIEERLGGDEDENALEALGAADARTPLDWLSRDDAEVDKYIADPLCGFALGADAMVSMMEPSMTASTLEAISAIRKDLPVLFIAGTQDPVNGNMEYLKILEERWNAAGIAGIETHYYEGARHELLNETNKDEVTARVIAWMDEAV
jgi:alpha-beta hydrolase superfamily lysophospholipase